MGKKRQIKKQARAKVSSQITFDGNKLLFGEGKFKRNE
jgi:hypothetical protein